jgi:superoxide dismutase, Cu-Zn family
VKTAFDSTIRLGTALLSIALLGAIGCRDDGEARATARLVDTNGRELGTATFRAIDEGVLVTIEAQGLPPGVHAVHVHERGECAPPSFESAGDHFNPFAKGHGFADEDGAHAGDLENLVADDAGKVHALRVVKGATLDRNAATSAPSLLRAGGTALVIHVDPDDYRSEPAGNAGSRIACGVIEVETSA